MDKKYIRCLAACMLCALLSAAGVSGCAKSGMDEAKNGTEGLQGSSTAQEAENMSSASQEELTDQVVFEGKDMEGNVVSSDIFAESKITMVNVWATYCNPCLSEMPILGELAGEYEAGDFRLIGIISDVQEGADQKVLDVAANLIEQTKADYSHLLLNESLYYGLLTEVTAVPTTFFIDEKGVVLDVVIGARDKTTWKGIIDGFLEE